MSRSPRSPRAGAFTKEFAADTIIYGLLMGIPPLITFVIVVYGFGNGNLGINCNENLNSTCTTVYRARATVFASLTIIILLHAFEMKDTRKSIFRMNLLVNRTLFYSVICGGLALFPTIYIPKLNEVVFKMMDITWEWGLCFASVVFYFVGTESYKACKRRFWKVEG
jgi:Na+-exporting ATPase